MVSQTQWVAHHQTERRGYGPFFNACDFSSSVLLSMLKILRSTATAMTATAIAVTFGGALCLL